MRSVNTLNEIQSNKLNINKNIRLSFEIEWNQSTRDNSFT